jgi:hypothetical protein
MAPYDIDFHNRGYIREHVWDFLLFPDHWRDPLNDIPIPLTWNNFPFESA